MAEPLETRQPAPAGAADTRAKLLDAAEILFAQEGVHRASLRSITQAAGANLAAVNYHFGSKEALIREVLARRLGPLNEARLVLLNDAERAGDTPRLELVAEAFIRPALEMVEKQKGGLEFARLVGRTFSEPDEDFRNLVMDQFREVITRFSAALARALPGLGQEDLFWRFHFMVGSIIHTAGMGFLAHRLSGGLCDPADVDGQIDRLVAFVCGGFEAEASGHAS